jgi:hypothetical protein
MSNNPSSIAESGVPTHEIPQPLPPADELDQRVAEAAYYLAEKRGFAPGHEMEDWLEAEEDIHNQDIHGD